MTRAVHDRNVCTNVNPLLKLLYEGAQLTVPETPPTVQSFDWAAAGVRTRYILCITPRSGSTWLSSLLAATGRCGNPREFFNRTELLKKARRLEASSFPDYFASVVREYQLSSTFGLVIDLHRMRSLCEVIDFQAVFLDPGSRFVALFRRDLLAQAISTLTAVKTGLWHRVDRNGTVREKRTEPACEEPLTDLEDADIWKWILSFVTLERSWETAFVRFGVNPLRLHYEDLVTGPERQVLRVMRHILGDGLRSDTALFEQVAGLEHKTQRLAGSFSWQIWTRFTLTYFDELEQVYRLRSRLEVSDFREYLRRRYGLEIAAGTNMAVPPRSPRFRAQGR